MWGLISNLFLVLYCLMSIYIGWKSWNYLGRNSSGLVRTTLIVFYLLLILSFPLTEMVGRILPDDFRTGAEIWGWYTMLSIVYIFILVLAIDILRLINRRKFLISALPLNHPNTPRFITAFIITVVIVTLAYGTWNAHHPIVNAYNIKVDKKAGQINQLHIAMISDIHYGTMVDVSRLQKMAQILIEMQPDIILLAGDIIEGTPQQDQVEDFKKALGQVYAKYGIYAVSGNHDRYLRNPEGVEWFRQAGIRVLKNESVQIGNSFYIIGRDDRLQREKQISAYIRDMDTALPIILLAHQPTDLEEVQKERIDLQLAGHTHHGQIFPANLVTASIYELDWGLMIKDNYHLIVSSGYGTWGPPLRIGTRPEIVSIMISFKE